jgi:tetratricopeptide (TPR) repeat protein
MDFDAKTYLNELQEIPVNELLDQLEVDLSHLGQYKPEQAVRMLLKMDIAFQKIQAMTTANHPAVAERAQFLYLISSIEKNCRALLRDLGGRDALFKLRESVLPAPENGWWFPDRTCDEQNRRSLRSFAITIAVLTLLVVVGGVVYNLFLKPDPLVVARYNREMELDLALERNDLPAALNAVNQAIALGGDTKSLIVRRGVVETMMAQTEQAAADFKTAEVEFGSRALFLVTRTDAWIRAGQFDAALKDATEAVALDPSSAENLYYFGKANELKQNYNAALDAYQKASDLAEKQGKAELNATIRITMAMLMQSSAAQFPTEMPTPTPRVR